MTGATATEHCRRGLTGAHRLAWHNGARFSVRLLEAGAAPAATIVELVRQRLSADGEHCSHAAQARWNRLRSRFPAGGGSLPTLSFARFARFASVLKRRLPPGTIRPARGRDQTAGAIPRRRRTRDRARDDRLPRLRADPVVAGRLAGVPRPPAAHRGGARGATAGNHGCAGRSDRRLSLRLCASAGAARLVR